MAPGDPSRRDPRVPVAGAAGHHRGGGRRDCVHRSLSAQPVRSQCWRAALELGVGFYSYSALGTDRYPLVFATGGMPCFSGSWPQPVASDDLDCRSITRRVIATTALVIAGLAFAYETERGSYVANPGEQHMRGQFWALRRDGSAALDLHFFKLEGRSVGMATTALVGAAVAIFARYPLRLPKRGQRYQAATRSPKRPDRAVPDATPHCCSEVRVS